MTQKPELEQMYDVAVVGGGAAGLSGAVTLGRSLRSVVVIDAGAPRNAPADGVHNYLTRDGISPADLVAVGREEVARYGGVVIDGEAVDAVRVVEGFRLRLADGRTTRARRLLVTTGLVDELPDVPGVRELWGIDVHHCPFCHGWEIRGQAIGFLGTATAPLSRSLLFRQWTPDLVVFKHEAAAPSEAEAEQLAARGIRIVDSVVDSLVVTDGRLSGVRLADGRIEPRQALFVAPRMVARSGLLTALGLPTAEHPLGMGTFVASDPQGLTAVPGVWVAGNVTDLVAQVVTSAGAGVMAGAAINADLLAEDTDRAVTHRRTLSSVA